MNAFIFHQIVTETSMCGGWGCQDVDKIVCQNHRLFQQRIEFVL